MPVAYGPILVAAGETAEAGRRFLGPDGFVAGVGRGGRGVDDGDPFVLRAAQELQSPNPARCPMAGLLAGFENDTEFDGGFLAEFLRGRGLRVAVGTDFAR